MIFCGIDPGLTGALAIIHEDGKLEFHDTPALSLGKRNDHDLAEILQILRRVSDSGSAIVGLERVHAMPSNGTLSAFSMGRSMTAWEMGLVSFGISYRMVPPQSWKARLMNGQSKEKDASRQVAMRLFPSAIPHLSLKKHHGRADALLLAEYVRLTNNR